MDKKNKYKAQEEYQKRSGLISKSYKLQSGLVDQFAVACKKADISQSAAISEFMKKFIKKHAKNT